MHPLSHRSAYVEPKSGRVSAPASSTRMPSASPRTYPSSREHRTQLKPSKCVFYVFITSVYAHAFNSIDFPVTSH